jgi:hypothetical protein
VSPPFENDIGFSIKGAKLSSYLLNMNHPIGASKARFFLGHGFRPDKPEELAFALLNHSLHAQRRVPTPHGLRLICEGPIATPIGTAPLVKSVWQHKRETGFAELITAYPISVRP